MDLTHKTLAQEAPKVLTEYPIVNIRELLADSSLFLTILHLKSSRQNMRIFIIHNYYQDPGGEDGVFHQEAQLLGKTHTVKTYSKKNKKGLKGLRDFLFYPYNIFNTRQVLREIAAFKPDVVHIHNLHYTFGPQLIQAIKKRGYPLVFTLHNFRLLCPSATLFHKGKVYKKSLKNGYPFQAVKDKVLDNSWFKTCWTAWTYYLHRQLGTFLKVDKYIVLSELTKRLLQGPPTHIPDQQISIKPNFIPQKYAATGTEKSTPRGSDFLYIGRLTQEKGILKLMHHIKGTNLKLNIAGDGPLKGEITHLCKKHPDQFHYLGFQSKVQIAHLLKTCTALVFPSVWYEGMPLTSLEALSAGTPIIGSKLGVLQEMIKPGQTGLLFDPHSKNDTLNTLNKWLSLTEASRSIIGSNCLNEYREHYSEAINLQKLERIYKDVLKANRTKTHE